MRSFGKEVYASPLEIMKGQEDPNSSEEKVFIALTLNFTDGRISFQEDLDKQANKLVSLVRSIAQKLSSIPNSTNGHLW